MKGKRGITLIALIITIIVMLILVAVTINVAISGGLFGTAKKAVSKTEEEKQKEIAMSRGQVVIDGITYASMDDYLAGIPAMTEDYVWTRGTGEDRDKIYCILNGERHQFAEGQDYLMIGDVVNYTPSLATINGNQKIASIGMPDVGFTIAAVPGEQSLLTGEQSGMGEGNEQRITREENLRWIVLGIEDEHTLLLTTESPLTNGGDGISLKGAASYNNVVSVGDTEGQLDRICRELYGTNARSIKIEDVNNCLQYEPKKGVYLDADETPALLDPTISTLADLKKYGGPELTKTDDETKSLWQWITGSVFLTPDKPVNTAENNHLSSSYSGDSSGVLATYPLDVSAYALGDDELSIIDTGDLTPASPSAVTQLEKFVIFGSGDFSYWLASRGVFPRADDCFAEFGPGYVCDCVVTSFGNYEYGFDSDDGENSGGALPYRPVVSLKSEIPTFVEHLNITP